MFHRQFFFGVVCLSTTTLVEASIVDVCELAKKPIANNIELNQSDINKYQKQIAKECDLSSKYKKINEKLLEKNQVSLTDIVEYQAIRFVQRSWLSRAEAVQKPVEVIYQIWKKDYDLPVSQQSAATWDNWAMGVAQLLPTIADFKMNQKFDLVMLKKIHRGLFPFYPTVSEHGDFAHEPFPGILKPTASSDNENYWWSLETKAEIENARRVVQQENDLYRKLGLLTPAPKGYPFYVGDIMNVRDTTDRDDASRTITALFSGHSMMNRQNVELILEMADRLVSMASKGQHMVWQGKLFSPAELAYFVQQFYVRVHPFYEGNGRTSRFLQELILLSFDLPHGSSGDLMDFDALTSAAEYYEKAIDANFSLLSKMEQCSQEYGKREARKIDSSRLSYACRILVDRSAEWAKLVQANEIDHAAEFKKETDRLRQLDATTEKNHQRELARRKGIDTGKPIVVPTDVEVEVKNVDECEKMEGEEKLRCERFSEIKKRIGIK